MKTTFSSAVIVEDFPVPLRPSVDDLHHILSDEPVWFAPQRGDRLATRHRRLKIQELLDRSVSQTDGTKNRPCCFCARRYRSGHRGQGIRCYLDRFEFRNGSNSEVYECRQVERNQVRFDRT